MEFARIAAGPFLGRKAKTNGQRYLVVEGGNRACTNRSKRLRGALKRRHCQQLRRVTLPAHELAVKESHMRGARFLVVTVSAALLLAATAPSVAADAAAKRAKDACHLITSAEIKKVTGQTPPEPQPVGAVQGGSQCGWILADGTKINTLLVTGSSATTRFDGTKLGSVNEPVAGLGKAFLVTEANSVFMLKGSTLVIVAVQSSDYTPCFSINPAAPCPPPTNDQGANGRRKQVERLAKLARKRI